MHALLAWQQHTKNAQENAQQLSSPAAWCVACMQASSGTGQLLRDAAINMHSALQQMVDDACRRAKKAPWTLRTAQGYELVYKAHCTRKQGDKGGAPSPHLHVSFTRDDYLRGCELLLASDDPLDARTLSLTTYQAATVSRGDDVKQPLQQQQQSDGRPPGLSDAEWQAVLQLRQQQQRRPGLSDAEWQMVQRTRQASRQAPAQQQQQRSGQLGSTLLQGMGTVEPLGEIALPHITAQGAAAAALGAAGAHTATMGCAGGSVPADGVVEALLELRQLIMQQQQQQGCCCAGMQQQQQQQNQCEDQDMGEAGGAGEVLQQQQQQHQQQQQKHSKKGVKPFPSLSMHTSMEALAHWYAVQPHHSAEAEGRTIKQMEDAGSPAWRAGGSKQRWSEYMVLLTALQEKQDQLVDAQRRLGRRGVQVDLVAAAQKLDEERLALPNPNPKSTKPMSVCQFREHLTAQAHASAVARLAAEEAEAAGAEQ
jgi:hypothetical protein